MCLNYQSDLCGREEGEAVFPRVGRGLTCFGCCLHSLLPVFSLRQWQGSCPKGSTHRPKWTEYSSESKEKKKTTVFEKTRSWGQCRGCFVSLRSGRQAEGPRLVFLLYSKQIKDRDRKGQVSGNRKNWCKETAHVSSQPTALAAKSGVQTRRHHGVFTQVANETRTSDRYVSSSALRHGSRCPPGGLEVDPSVTFSQICVGLYHYSHLPVSRGALCPQFSVSRFATGFGRRAFHPPLVFLLPQHGSPVWWIRARSLTFVTLATDSRRARPWMDPKTPASATTDTPETGQRFATVSGDARSGTGLVWRTRRGRGRLSGPGAWNALF